MLSQAGMCGAMMNSSRIARSTMGNHMIQMRLMVVHLSPGWSPCSEYNNKKRTNKKNLCFGIPTTSLERVTINLTKVNNQFWILNQLNLLNQAFDSACNWFFKEKY